MMSDHVRLPLVRPAPFGVLARVQMTPARPRAMLAERWVTTRAT